ncbi:uncharacterized protein LOC109600259 [Aethina tumida]|uniref:uncharacterized protein LOC109600259 n=1 Tax=Aethina tumida TaxID=116153 RepID=UPI00214938A4|nr:uncharacterized protein LOC109600259 [Aethina tumida]XP_049820950.1 uncharacterized protein LOC109600259 [Aethina tumida]
MYIDIFGILGDYGWYILGSSIVLGYIYHTFIKEKIVAYWQKKEEQDYAAKYHKNPDLLNARLQAQEAYVKKLQEQYNIDLEEYKRKQEEKEAKRREEILRNAPGHRLGGDEDDSNKPNGRGLRSEFFPLMGGGSGNSYRPPRRSPCGGGGCGR